MPFNPNVDVGSSDDEHLRWLHLAIHRAAGTWKKSGSYGDWTLGQLSRKYRAILNEMDRRGMNYERIDTFDGWLRRNNEMRGPAFEKDNTQLESEFAKEYSFDINFNPEEKSDSELTDMFVELLEIYEDYINSDDVPSKEDVYNVYKLLVDEMESRDIDYTPIPEIEHQLQADTRPSGDGDGDFITREDVLQHFDDFDISKPIVWLVGSLATQGRTNNDIDILIDLKRNNPICEIIRFRIFRMLSEDLANNIQFLYRDERPGPFTDHIPLFSLKSELLDDFDVIEMQGGFKKMMKPIIGYKKGEAYGWDAIRQVIPESAYPVIAEKKFDGTNCQFHKNDGEVTIYSDGGDDITHRLPLFVEIMKDWSIDNFAICAEVEMWKNNSHKGRSVISGFINTDADASKEDNENIVSNVYDVIIWQDQDVTEKEFEFRRDLVEDLPIGQSIMSEPKTGQFNVSPAEVVHNVDDLVKEGKDVTEEEGSEGAMFKSLASTYNTDGEGWWKYKETVRFYVEVVDKIETKTSGVYNYKMGVQPHEHTPDDDIMEVDDEEYAYLGKTMNSSIDISVGSKIEVSAENVFKYKAGNVRLYIPVVIQETDNPPDDIKTILKKARDAGKYVEKKEMQNSQDMELAKPKDYPDIDPDNQTDFVIQLHGRGKSVSDRTPIITKENNNINIIPIEELWPTSTSGEGQVELDSDIKIWTDEGWQDAKYIMRHRCDSRLKRIISGSGLIEVTDDHSLFRNGNPIQTSNLKEDEHIDLVDLPNLDGNITVDPDYAWVLGFLLGDGCQDDLRQSYRCTFTNSNPEYLDKVEQFANKYGLNTNRYLDGSTEKVQLSDISFNNVYSSPKGKTKSGNASTKKIPDHVFKWDKQSQKHLLDGYLCADGICYEEDHIQFASKSQALLQGMMLIAKRIYPDKQIITNNRCDLAEVRLGKSEHNITSEPDKIRKIIPALHSWPNRGKQNGRYKDGKFQNKKIGLKEHEWVYNNRRYVYDIETESHDFCAGVGRIKAHNSWHKDFRIKWNDHLQGFTLDAQIEGEITEDFETFKKAKEIAENADWKWPKQDDKALVQFKAEQAPEWLDEEGLKEKGEVGASKNEFGAYIITNKDDLYVGAIKNWFFEFFVPNVREDEDYTRIIIREIPQDGSSYWISWIPEDQKPYVLQDSAIEDGWVPPEEWSAMPPEWRDKISDDYKFWNQEDKEERIKMRDELVDKEDLQDNFVCECLECGHIVESEDHCKDIECPECGGEMRRLERPGEGRHEQTQDFHLLRHWWKGQFVVRWGPSKEHWDLFYNGKQVVLDSNPLESNEVGAGIREPYSNDFAQKGADGPEYIEPGTPGNPTKETPCWAERVDKGSVELETDTDTKKVFNFEGDELTSTWILEREDENTNLWAMKKQEQNSELQLHHLSCDTPVEIEMMAMLPTGNMKIEGCILGEGVWNGYFWPGDVVEDVGGDVIKDLQIDVGPDHEDKITDAGNVINYQWDDQKKGWHIEAIIDDKEAIERAQSLEDPGWSIEASAYSDNVKNIIKEITDLKSAVLVKVPACKTCYVS